MVGQAASAWPCAPRVKTAISDAQASNDVRDLAIVLKIALDLPLMRAADAALPRPKSCDI
jgi:hypothetical protein